MTQSRVNSSLENNAELPENHWAALDIGSNSFHFVYVRERDHQIELLHREKYAVQLAAGLNQQLALSDEAIEQALQVLEKLAHTTAKLSVDHFRVVATYTLRTATNAQQFITQAKQIFPFDIEIISGHEEARLIYQGVAHNHVALGSRLVVDIGGGSTEFIIGEGFTPLTLSSINMGCVSFQQRFFADGVITAEGFRQAKLAASVKLEKMAARFKRFGWHQAIGTSGTFKTLWQMTQTLCPEKQFIDKQALNAIEQQLLRYKNCKNIDFIPLKSKRKRVICGGVAVASALFDMLNIAHLEYCDYALRDGVLVELMDATPFEDVRERTIVGLMQRFSVEQQQVQAVWQVAEQLLKQLGQYWQLTGTLYPKLLRWACSLHEIGFDINPTGYHTHGAYIISNSDMPGFNQEHQTVLAWLLANHRKKITPLDQAKLSSLSIDKLTKILLILRCAVLINQQRNLSEVPELECQLTEHQLNVLFLHDWLTLRPIIALELEQETKWLAQQGLSVDFISANEHS